jgi:hypothetical protein
VSPIVIVLLPTLYLEHSGEKINGSFDENGRQKKGKGPKNNCNEESKKDDNQEETGNAKKLLQLS